MGLRTLSLIALAGVVGLSSDHVSAQERQPVPSAAAQEEAIKLVKDVYGEKHDAAKTPKEKTALAKEVIQSAEKATELTNRFALLRVARDVATQAGDGVTAFQAINEMARTFQVDTIRMKASVLFSFSKQAKSTAQHKSVAEEALKLVTDAVAQDQFDLAAKIMELAVAESRKSRDSGFLKDALARSEDVEQRAAAYKEYAAALAKLEEHPTDSDANLTVGKYHCFVRGDWVAGLPMLVLSSDAELKKLAEMELGESPSALALGDAWWDFGEERTAKLRAAYWYKKALPSLAGLVKEKVDKRLAGLGSEKEEKQRRTVLVADGRPKVPVRAEKPWTLGNGFAEGQGYIKGKGVGRISGFANGIRFGTELGEEDFILELVMSVQIVDGTSSRLELYGNGNRRAEFYLDGATGNLGCAGPLIKGGRNLGSAARYLKKGVPFQCELARQGSTLVWSIDGRELVKMTLTEKKLGQFAVVPFRGRIRLYDVVLKQ